MQQDQLSDCLNNDINVHVYSGFTLLHAALPVNRVVVAFLQEAAVNLLYLIEILDVSDRVNASHASLQTVSRVNRNCSKQRGSISSSSQRACWVIKKPQSSHFSAHKHRTDPPSCSHTPRLHVKMNRAANWSLINLNVCVVGRTVLFWLWASGQKLRGVCVCVRSFCM